MSFIPMTSESDARGDLARVYKQIASGGPVANILKVHGSHPAALRAHLQLYRTLLFGDSELTRATREMIAVVVSATNRCHY
jgi:alkylhydroperoxidase family enzyme